MGLVPDPLQQMEGFFGADLSGVLMDKVDFSGADFSEANLVGVIASGSNFSGDPRARTIVAAVVGGVVWVVHWFWLKATFGIPGEVHLAAGSESNFHLTQRAVKRIARGE